MRSNTIILSKLNAGWTPSTLFLNYVSSRPFPTYSVGDPFGGLLTMYIGTCVSKRLRLIKADFADGSAAWIGDIVR